MNKKIYLIKNETNVGLTAGLNIGYKFSVNQNYDYIARIDCDFIISKKYLENMKNLFQQDKMIVAASPKIKHAFLRKHRCVPWIITAWKTSERIGTP